MCTPYGPGMTWLVIRDTHDSVEELTHLPLRDVAKILHV